MKKLNFLEIAVIAVLALQFDVKAFYDPSLQRWINRDPIGERGGVNPHSFVGNNPMTTADNWGLKYGNPVSGPNGPIPPNFPWDPPPPNLPTDLLSCMLRIKNEVWSTFGWDQQKNPAPGHHAGDNSFHYGHCVASCRTVRECGLLARPAAWTAGLIKEIEDQFKKWFMKEGDGFDFGDLHANWEGRVRGCKMKNKSCEEACLGTEG